MLWDPAFFGVRPHVVVKGGMIAWAQMGDANASIPTPQPVLPRPMFGAYGVVPARTSVHFVAPAAIEAGLADRLAVDRRLVAGRRHHPADQGRPAGERRAARIEVDPDTFTVPIDGEVVEPEPVRELPMAQRYFLF